MKFATIRDFRINASRVIRDAETDEVLVTRRGRPSALLIPILENENIDTIREVIKQARLKEILVNIWDESNKKGTDKITLGEINAEICKSRKDKKKAARQDRS